MLSGSRLRYFIWILFFLISSGTVFAYFGQEWQDATSLLSGIKVISNGSNPKNGLTYHPDTEKWTCNSTNTVKSTSKDVTGDIQTGCKWQCVELAQRYYYLTPNFDYHIGNSAMWDVDYAYQMFDRVDKKSFASPYNDLQSYENDRIKNPPLPVEGDLIIFSKKGEENGAAGHVAVVGKVKDGIFTIAEQNMDESGQGLRTLKINPNVKEAEIIIPERGTPVRGWIRSPKNPNIPKLNKMILSQNRTMQVKIISYSSECAGDLKQLNLESNTDKTLVENYQNNIGKTVDLGTFAQGSEIAFAIDTRKSSCYKYRPSTHTDFAKVTELKTDHWKIEWEDQDSGGNGDFDDLVIEILPTPPQQNENYIVSDTRTQWNNNGSWENAVESWVHPAWSSLANATWIWKTYKVTQEEAVNGVTVEFRHLFTLPDNMSGTITVYADNGVEVFLNNILVKKLLCFDAGSASMRQECTISYSLEGKSGQNELRFVVTSTPREQGSSPEINPAGLIFRAEF